MPRVIAWARLGSNQPCTRNAPVERRLVSPSFAGQTRLARLVARRVSTTLTDRSDGHRKDTPGLFAVFGMASGFAPTFVPRVWRNHAAPSQQTGYLPGFTGVAADLVTVGGAA